MHVSERRVRIKNGRRIEDLQTVFRNRKVFRLAKVPPAEIIEKSLILDSKEVTQPNDRILAENKPFNNVTCDSYIS
jgi:hypothetical protein